jgi:hypothetical protein
MIWSAKARERQSSEEGAQTLEAINQLYIQRHLLQEDLCAAGPLCADSRS